MANRIAIEDADMPGKMHLGIDGSRTHHPMANRIFLEYGDMQGAIHVESH